jgi:ribosomal protein S27E
MTMARYIDVEKEIASMQSVLDQRSEGKGTVAYFAFEKIIERLKNAPTADVVPVVRCKDCEHGQFMPACSMYLCHCTGGKLRYSDDYCNYGERKEQE